MLTIRLPSLWASGFGAWDRFLGGLGLLDRCVGLNKAFHGRSQWPLQRALFEVIL